MEKVEGNIIDIRNRRIYSGEVRIKEGRIEDIIPNEKVYAHFICPGFIDAHVHIESSMLLPDRFADMVVERGVIAVINDPHEIANVMGREGVERMMENARNACIKIFFGIPSCVPATPFDSNGGKIDIDDMKILLKSKNNFVVLSEVMNVPGVLQKEKETMEKLEIARTKGLKIDGHAPGLRGKDLERYIREGITTDHECVDFEEAEEKMSKGMKVIIRQGSAARNYEKLKKLIPLYPDRLMFCTDDAHPDDVLKNGSVDRIVRKAIEDGFDLFDILQIACLNPIDHYHLPVGTLRKGEKADFIRIENLKDFKTSAVYIEGKKMYDSGIKRKIRAKSEEIYNHFNRSCITRNELNKKINKTLLAIRVEDGNIVTYRQSFDCETKENFESDIKRDILKLVYLNRYRESTPQIAYITGIGLKKGAFATSISHDSHNILAVGCQDEDLLKAINTLIEMKGGLVVVKEGEIKTLPLPIGGIISEKDAWTVSEKYQGLNKLLQVNGCKLQAPFMTLSFMSLLVIPEIKIGEKGLFDGNVFSFIEERSL